MPWETRSLTTYDLASRGGTTSGADQCNGTWVSDQSYGPGFQYACIHSDSTEYSGGDTVWYNYVLASAGTIVDENTSSSNPATNMNKATESICPKGWTLPSTTQLDSNRNVAIFSPVLSGTYNNGKLTNNGIEGNWWGSMASSINASRHRLTYTSDALSTGGLRRYDGIAIRCVQAS